MIGIILLAALGGLFVYDHEQDRDELYEDIGAAIGEFRSDREQSVSLWPDEITDFDANSVPHMDVWPKDRRHTFTVPYHWDKVQGEDMRISLVGEAMVTATVLGTDLCHKDFTALSPIDIAVSWSDFITDKSLSELDISFGNRQANLHGSKLQGEWTNMHIIPGSPELEAGLRDLRKGDRLVLRGYAVRVAPSGNWASWNSDLYFGDSNCGILIVTELYAEDQRSRTKIKLSASE